MFVLAPWARTSRWLAFLGRTKSAETSPFSGVAVNFSCFSSWAISQLRFFTTAGLGNGHNAMVQDRQLCVIITRYRSHIVATLCIASVLLAAITAVSVSWR